MSAVSPSINEDVILKPIQRWEPEIFLPDYEGSLTNIVSRLKPSLVETALYAGLGYPKNASFRFGNFSGPEDQDAIIKAIVASAAMTGSTLRASKRKKTSKTRAMQVDIFCIRSKPYDGKYHSHCFEANCIQAPNTILQRNHRQSKRKSSKLHQETAKSPESSQSTPKKRYRNTTKLSITKHQCCNFGFSIFCSATDSNWYLSYTST